MESSGHSKGSKPHDVKMTIFIIMTWLWKKLCVTVGERKEAVMLDVHRLHCQRSKKDLCHDNDGSTYNRLLHQRKQDVLHSIIAKSKREKTDFKSFLFSFLSESHNEFDRVGQQPNEPVPLESNHRVDHHQAGHIVSTSTHLEPRKSSLTSFHISPIRFSLPYVHILFPFRDSQQR